MVVLLTLFVICIWVQILFWSISTFKLYRHSTTHISSPLPTVSVLICAKNETKNILHCLKDILAQDYPNYEIIVADDYSTDSTAQTIKNLQLEANGKLTYFTPSKDILGKKLAITEGVNRAQGEWIVVTDADCRIPSNQWLREMMSNASIDTDLILGIGDYEQSDSVVSKLLQYETWYIAIQYLSAALLNRTYMGVGRNMAFRRSAFIATDPFKSNPQGPGDDDAIVAAIASRTNVAISLSSGSMTTSTLPESFSWADYFQKKKRHISPFSSYSISTQMGLSLLGFTHIGTYLFGGVLLFSAYCNLVLALIILRWLMMVILASRMAKKVPINTTIRNIPALDLALAAFYLIQVLFLPQQKQNW